jgi:ATP-dependent helicase/nuclease subunit A
MSSLRQAFARLNRYRDWLREGPLPVTLERIAADLGLWGLAAAIGQSDPLERGLDWLRARWHSFLSLEELLAEFEELAMGRSHIDWSLEPRGGGHGVVRVMNLHKAKGLEAPIVILADPSNAQDTTADLHIDRSGGHSHGWTVISEERSVGERTIRELLAHPPDWDLHAARESRFLEAERHRLLYVAATRAGVQLVVSADLSEPPKSKHLWQFFGPFLAGRPVIELPEETIEPTETTGEKTAKPSAREVSQAMAEARRLVETMTRPGSVSRTVGELAKRAPARRYDIVDEDIRGTAWGRVIHQLLEYRMTRPDADLRTAARVLLADEEESLVDRLPEALELVESVARSETWQRATTCSDRFVEIPFTLPWDLPDETGRLVPGLLHGRLDLVFREPEGWVIVDYKTDPIPREGVGSLVARYREQVALYAEAWERITGEPVREAGLYFTRAETYVEVRIGN